jgi:hypothetical protein
MSATVRSAGRCVWSSTPKVSKFNKSVECGRGRVTRSARFKANTSVKARDYTLTLKVIGKYPATDHLKVIEAGATARKTTTTLTVSELSLGNVAGVLTDASDWKAVVKGSGGASPTPTAGQVTFTLSIGATVLATFTGSASNPAECSFNAAITGTGETLKSVSPDLCSGGVAGNVQVTAAQINMPNIDVHANYAGGGGWTSSLSGSVNPETIPSGSSVSA